MTGEKASVVIRESALGSSGGADQKAWGELRQLMTGTTSIMASGNAAGMLRNLDSVTYQEGLGQPAVRCADLSAWR